MSTSVTPQGAGQQGIVPRTVSFFRGVNLELRKVTWPDLPQVRSATLAIIIFVLVLGLFISLLDLVLKGILVQAIPSLVS